MTVEFLKSQFISDIFFSKGFNYLRNIKYIFNLNNLILIKHTYAVAIVKKTRLIKIETISASLFRTLSCTFSLSLSVFLALCTLDQLFGFEQIFHMIPRRYRIDAVDIASQLLANLILLIDAIVGNTNCPISL